MKPKISHVYVRRMGKKLIYLVPLHRKFGSQTISHKKKIWRDIQTEFKKKGFLGASVVLLISWQMKEREIGLFGDTKSIMVGALKIIYD